MPNKNPHKLRHVVLTYDCNRACSYCYAKKLSDKFQSMSLDQFSRVVEWLKNQNINKLNLIGGEPTVYNDLPQILKLMKENEFTASLFTNCVFGNKVLKKIDFEIVNYFFINYNCPSQYRKDEYERFKSNLKCIKENTPNVTLRYNIFSTDSSFKHIIDAISQYDIHRISYSLCVPNTFRTNAYTKVSEFRLTTSSIIEFVEACSEMGVKPRLARPIPFCLFDPYERTLMRRKSNLMGTCNPSSSVYVINPDLSIFPCTTLLLEKSKTINLSNICTEKDIFNFYKDIIEKLQWKLNIYKKCNSCKFFRRKQCHGSCLAYKYKPGI